MVLVLIDLVKFYYFEGDNCANVSLCENEFDNPGLWFDEDVSF